MVKRNPQEEHIEEQKNREYSEETASTEKISLWSILISLIVISGVTVIFQRNTWYSQGPSISTNSVPSMIGIAVVVLGITYNVVVKKIAPGLRLSQKDLVSMYSMIMMGILIIGFGCMFYLPFTTMAWQREVVILRHSEFRPLFDRLSPLIGPTDEDAIIDFWMGGSSVPWREWILPVLSWTLFSGVFFFTFLCLINLFREKWTDRERLLYPLATPIVEITEGGEEGFGPFWRNRLALLGIGLAVLYGILNGLNRYFPAVPPLGINIFFHEFADGAIANALKGRAEPSVRFNLTSPTLLAIGLLIPTQITFSIWSLYVLYRLVFYPFAYSTGWEMRSRTPTQSHAAGSRIGLILMFLWQERHKISYALRKPFVRKDGKIDDSKEAMSYSMSVYGLIIGVAFLVIFSKYFLFAETWWASLYWFVVVIASSAVLTRWRVEAGIPEASSMEDNLPLPIIQHFGRYMDPGTGALNGHLYWPYLKSFFEGSAPIVLEGLYLGDKVKLNRKNVIKVLIGVFIFASLFAWFSALNLFYERGAGYAWFSDVPSASGPSFYGSYQRVWTDVLDVKGAVLHFGLIGVLATLLLTFLHSMYIWWPINPIGYIFATHFNTSWTYWSHFLVAWIIKTCIMRFGGPTIYKKVIPLFTGIIIGSSLAEFIWQIVALIVGR